MRIKIKRLCRIGQADLVEQFGGAPAGGGARQVQMDADLFLDLPTDRVHGRQRGHRILRDEADLATADPAHLTLWQFKKTPAAEAHETLDLRVAAVSQSKNAQKRNGF